MWLNYTEEVLQFVLSVLTEKEIKLPMHVFSCYRGESEQDAPRRQHFLEKRECTEAFVPRDEYSVSPSGLNKQALI